MESLAPKSEEDEIDHLLDEIIYLSSQHQKDGFLRTLLWPRGVINAFRILYLKSNNPCLPNDYSRGIKISVFFLITFIFIQISAFVCLSRLIINTFAIIFLSHGNKFDSFSENFSSSTWSGIGLILLLYFLYGGHYKDLIRLTPTFHDYIKQKNELRSFSLSEELRLREQRFRVGEKKQEMLMDVLAQAYNALLAIQANEQYSSKRYNQLLNTMSSLVHDSDFRLNYPEFQQDKSSDPNRVNENPDDPFQ